MRHLHQQAAQRGHGGCRSGLLGLISSAVVAVLLAAPAFAPLAEAQGRQFYGVATQTPDRVGHLLAPDYNRMERGGVGTLRFAIIWDRGEPSPGHYRWDESDRIVGNAAVRGVRVLPYVLAPPDHVRNPPTRPADREAFRDFMAALARRYGRGGTYWNGPYQHQHGTHAKPRPVRAWQLFNEQNGRFWWREPAAPRAYGRLVRAGARGVRSRSPRAEIVLGGMFATPSGAGSMTSWGFLRHLYAVPRIKRAFDTVAVHPYAANLGGVRIQMRRMRNVMRRNNDHAARIRVTEFGWGSQPSGHPLTKTPKGQARLLRKSFRLFKRQRDRRGWNVGGVNWFSWQDGSGCPFCASSGLFSGPPHDRKLKRSWRTFMRVAR